MRRGQAEIFGLVLIVLFIAIGFLLFIRFTLNDNGGNGLKETYEGKQMGQTFVNSIVKTEIDCGNKVESIRNVIIDIASGRSDTCNGDYGDTAINLNKSIEKILNQTLDLLMVNYRFSIVRPTGNNEVPIDDHLNIFLNHNYLPIEQCSSRMPRDANQVPIPLATIQGNVFVRIERC